MDGLSGQLEKMRQFVGSFGELFGNT
jgi:hypothetical protein